ncbi:shikimate dehydrogenase family protein [Marinigracilibium pacificum]|uniref:Shikimate dehydrogenase n=1 Tax=Marinigracilibium pacificum TaxID=2729599 RepID=A0A848J2H8_9BACT|nr:shikimate dehydrogenase [Marinigracilibium pacificum]NMM47392.1 shikimate dehydrogenase [Marinigracilibium pacificum]
MRKFGLIGFPLSHSFSKKYFTEKFTKGGIKNASYELYPIEKASEFLKLFQSNPELEGINVTIPHKETVVQYLDELDDSAKKVGAVNVIRKEGDKLVGYNSDFYGFSQSLEDFTDGKIPERALVLGTGGASKAVVAALKMMNCKVTLVSRAKSKEVLTYEELKKNPDFVKENLLIVNTTPLGMSPNVESKPDLDYSLISSDHILFDLVYNPSESTFMKEGKAQGAKVKNGYQMLVMQAERAWEIWNN